MIFLVPETALGFWRNTMSDLHHFANLPANPANFRSPEENQLFTEVTASANLLQEIVGPFNAGAVQLYLSALNRKALQRSHAEIIAENTLPQADIALLRGYLWSGCGDFKEEDDLLLRLSAPKQVIEQVPAWRQYFPKMEVWWYWNDPALDAVILADQICLARWTVGLTQAPTNAGVQAIIAARRRMSNIDPTNSAAVSAFLSLGLSWILLFSGILPRQAGSKMIWPIYLVDPAYVDAAKIGTIIVFLIFVLSSVVLGWRFGKRKKRRVATTFAREHRPLAPLISAN